MEININIKCKKIKLNEELFLNSIIKMENSTQTQKNPQTNPQSIHAIYVRQEMANGLSEFQASVKFLMDENVPQKYKDLYRKNQNQVVEAMDLDEYPERPKLVRS